jgi:hypothetical protein
LPETQASLPWCSADGSKTNRRTDPFAGSKWTHEPSSSCEREIH